MKRRKQHQPCVSVRPEIYARLAKRADELGITRAALLEQIVNRTVEERSVARRQHSLHVSPTTHDRISKHAAALGITMKALVERALIPVEQAAINTISSGER